MDLVGPGPAYERWKKTPEYQEWLKETGQLKDRAAAKPETGAFVLLGGKGVAERKFDTLAEAVQAASDGDTIEIRGNGPFVSEPINIRRHGAHDPGRRRLPAGHQAEPPEAVGKPALCEHAMPTGAGRPGVPVAATGRTTGQPCSIAQWEPLAGRQLPLSHGRMDAESDATLLRWRRFANCACATAQFVGIRTAFVLHRHDPQEQSLDNCLHGRRAMAVEYRTPRSFESPQREHSGATSKRPSNCEIDPICSQGGASQFGSRVVIRQHL